MAQEYGYNKLKRIYPLQEWDISFSINGDVLNRFLTFTEDIHPDLPMVFYKDKIVIRQRSSDNISFVNINIEIIDSMNYDPGLGEDAKESDRKIVIIDATGLAGEIADYAKGADMITVRIDTKRLRKCEFTCGEYRKHKITLVEPEDFYKLETTEKKIKANRDNPAAKGCDMVIEPETFIKICALGGKKGGADMIFEVSKKGLLVYTSDEDSGTSFEILNDQNQYGINVDDEGNDIGDIEGDGDDDNDVQELDDFEYTREEGEDENGIDNVPEDSIVSSDNVDNSVNEDNNETGIATVDDWNMPIPHTDTDMNVNKSSKKKDKKKEKKKDKVVKEQKKKATNTVVSKSKFILFSMNEKIDNISVIERKEYISAINKLKSQSPILIEIRHNAPLIIEQNSPGMWRATLTIAPIIPENS